MPLTSAWPGGERHGDHSMPHRDHQSRPHRGSRSCQQACPAHNRAVPGSRPACWISAGRRRDRRATGPCWPDNRACHCVWQHCAAVRARSCWLIAPNCALWHELRHPWPTRSRCLPVPRMSGTGCQSASPLAPNALVASPRPSETIARQPVLKHPRRSPLPRWIAHEQWLARNGTGSHAARLAADQANASCTACNHPTPACEPSSQPPNAWCCDDRLNPL